MVSFKEGLDRLKFNKKEIILFLQACINSYEGEHGKVATVLQDEKTLNVNNVVTIFLQYLLLHRFFNC